MPIYEYRCDSCGHELETIQKISEAPLVTCPECEQEALVKKVSAAGFRLKGGGWYETDFKSGNKRNISGKDDGKADGKGEGKKEGAEAGAASSSHSSGESKSAKDNGKADKAASSKSDSGKAKAS